MNKPNRQHILDSLCLYPALDSHYYTVGLENSDEDALYSFN